MLKLALGPNLHLPVLNRGKHGPLRDVTIPILRTCDCIPWWLELSVTQGGLKPHKHRPHCGNIYRWYRIVKGQHLEHSNPDTGGTTLQKEWWWPLGVSHSQSKLL